MGIDYSLACGDCLEFIDLHKWPICQKAADCLITAYGKSLSFSDCNDFQSKKISGLSSHPLVPLTSSQIATAISESEFSQSYIKELVPFVQNFISSHQNHFLFLTCDLGDKPWEFGEPKCYEWKEIQAVFNFHSQFLSKNLVEDFEFTAWEEVLDHYSFFAPWFLHQQLQEERIALKQAFEQEVMSL